MLRRLRQEFHKNSTISSIFTQLRQNLHMLRQIYTFQVHVKWRHINFSRMTKSHH